MKKKIRIIDQMFAHAKYSTDFQESKYIEWDRFSRYSDDDIIFFTDYSLDRAQSFNNKNKIAWLLESPDITWQSHGWITYNNTFTTVLTNSKELLDRGENYKFCPTGVVGLNQKIKKFMKKIN